MKLSDPQKAVLRKLRESSQPATSETYSVDALIRRGLVTAKANGDFKLTPAGTRLANRLFRESS